MAQRKTEREKIEELLKGPTGPTMRATTAPVEPFAAPPQDPATAALTKVRERLGDAAPFTVDPVVGAAKGVGSTAFGMRQVLERLRGFEPPGQIFTPGEDPGLVEAGVRPKFQLAEASERPSFLDPKTPGEKAGFFTERIGEFFVPHLAMKRVSILANLLRRPGLPGFISRVAAEGAGAGAVTAAQTGGDAQLAALNASMDAGVTASFGVLGTLTKPASRRVMRTAFGAVSKKIRDKGFDIENIFKYDLQGGFQSMLNRVDAKLKTLRSDLQAAIAREGDTQVDVLTLLEEAVEEVRAGGPKNFGKISDLEKAQDFFLEELISPTVAPDGLTGLVDTQDLKIAVGTFGSFVKGERKADLLAKEELANEFYAKLRDAIVVASPDVKKINQAFSDLIPIEAALFDRVPKSQRSQLLQLGDLVLISGAASAAASGNPAAQLGASVAGLLLAVRAIRSPRFAAFLSRTNEAAGATLGRVLAGTSVAIQP
jgi:hypothetical protein